MLPYLFTFLYILQLAQATSTNTTTIGCSPCETSSCNYRSIWSLLVSCGATLLICVWHAIHPSIPLPSFKRIHVVLYRLFIVLAAFCTPETVIMAAVYEWRKARWMKTKVHDRGHKWWTMTHSYFILIGGFALCDDTRIREIDIDEFLSLVEAGDIVNPVITKSEIMDKSTSDGLAKLILTVQLSWFIIQIIARLVNHLAVTLVELDTICMALLTLPLIFFWWGKPRCPGHPHVFYTRTFVNNYSRETTEGDDNTEKLPNKPTITTHRDLIADVLIPGRQHRHSIFPFALTWIIFGALHAIAWNYEFPTEIEKILWRVASLTLAGLPIVFGAIALAMLDLYTNRFNILVFSLQFFLVTTGVISRLLLVGLMLASLRSLPSSAFQTIPWTNYIPHL